MDNQSGSRSDQVRRSVARACIHGALLAAFSGAGGALLVWPQWVARNQCRVALASQLAYESDLAAQLEQAPAAPASTASDAGEAGPLRGKVLRPQDLARFPNEVQVVAQREGVKVAHVSFTPEVTPRWRALGARAAAPEEHVVAGVRPMVATVILTGSFEGLYRTVARLCGRKQLFIPDRWNLVPRAGSGMPPQEFKAEVAATMFVSKVPESAPHAARATGMLAMGGLSLPEVTND